MKEGVLHATQGRAISKFSSHDCSLSSALVVLRTVSETDQSTWRASTHICLPLQVATQGQALRLVQV